MEQEIDLCQFCKEREADIVDYGLLVCNPCLDERPCLKEALAEAYENDPIEQDHCE